MTQLDQTQLAQELARLFALPEGGWLSADGRSRALAIAVERSADWPAVAELLRGLQADFDFPMPAVATGAQGGYLLLYSLANALPAALLHCFGEAVQERYLADLPAARVSLPPPDACLPLPREDAASGRWTGLIDPSLGALFAEEGGLDFAPNPERQADLLRGVQVVPALAFERAWTSLQAQAEAASEAAAPAGARVPAPASVLTAPTGALPDAEVHAFLRSVMRDPAEAMAHRLRAAELLLQYPEQAG